MPKLSMQLQRSWYKIRKYELDIGTLNFTGKNVASPYDTPITTLTINRPYALFRSILTKILIQLISRTA